MNYIKQAVVYLVLLLPLAAFAQSSKEERKYNELAADIRKEIFGWKEAYYTDYKVPAKYEKESAVILSRTEIISGDKRGRSVCNMTNILRQIIKINDKAALETYSQLSYTQFIDQTRGRKLRNSIIGARVIKPNGEVKDVNIDEAVLTDQGNRNKKKKLAIPDLQVGDVLDYFVWYQDETMTPGGTPIYDYYIFASDNPILNYRIQINIDRYFAIYYKLANNAPDFVQSEKNGIKSLDLLVKDIPKAPLDLWMSKMRQLPMIRMTIAVPTSGWNFGREVLRPGDIVKDKSQQKIKDAAIASLRSSQYPISMYPLYKEIYKELKEYIERNRKATEEDIAEYAYYLLRFRLLYHADPAEPISVGANRNGYSFKNTFFLEYLNGLLKKVDIETAFLIVLSKYGPDSTNLYNASDYDVLLATTGEKPVYFSNTGMFTTAGAIPPEFEGQEAEAFGVSKKIDVPDTYHLPFSTFNDNLKSEKYEVSIDSSFSLINLQRETSCSGAFREDAQKELMLYEDYYDDERKWLKSSKSLLSSYSDTRANSTIYSEYKTAFAQARKDREEVVKSSIESEYSREPKNVQPLKIVKSGMHPAKEPAFVYTTAYSLDGLLKRAGNNYIFDAGKLIGGQVEIKEDFRTRKADIYQPFARSFEYYFNINIPAGYKVEGIDKLNYNIDNASAAFVTTAKIDGNKLVLTVKKTYKNAFDTADKWGLYLPVLDAANAYLNQKILLKKAS
ncbi:uncharacterized protein DUF3857 [Chitinophaga skermanii]|uniref:Uncharacterized protein DUF3857 n=1 Tax=Chitinophaga skermanii TaxID=331697 RepID=A0A327R0X5_9BACT|nr:DUF3857 domain-containing protein [Chitinophaga skermanii]RAJ10536.1 uncharacterized protein DUF3857 [Chitinophaga skermanii]